MTPRRVNRENAPQTPSAAGSGEADRSRPRASARGIPRAAWNNARRARGHAAVRRRLCESARGEGRHGANVRGLTG